MAVNKQAVITELEQGYLRGGVRVGVDESHALQARLRLALLQKYHAQDIAKDYGLFQRRLAAIGVEESFENAVYVEELLAFLDRFETAHQDVAHHLQQIAPKEMVEMVSGSIAEDAKLRRAEIQAHAKELVQQYRLNLNKSEQRRLEDDLAKTITSAAEQAQTPQEFRAILHKELSRFLAAHPDTRNTYRQPDVRERETETSVARVVDTNPVAAQRIFLGDATSEARIVERVAAVDVPSWRAYAAATNTLRLEPNETKGGFLERASRVARAAAVLSSDLSQTTVANTKPSGFIEAILSVQKDRRATDALKAFSKLTEQAKNAVSLVVIAKAWEDTVDVITKRAGGALVPVFDAIKDQANKEMGKQTGAPIEAAQKLVSSILDPFLRSTIDHVAAAEFITKTLREKPAGLVWGGSPQTAAATLLLLVTIEQHPDGLRFERRVIPEARLPVFVIRWVADSALERVVGRAAKSEAVTGFFGKVIRPILGFFGIKLGAKAATGVAGAAAGKGLSALIGSLLGGTVAPVVGHIVGFVGGFIALPLIQRAWGWVKNIVTGRVGQLGAVIGALEGTLGARGPTRQKQWYEQDWVPIVAIIAVAVLVPMFGAMMQTATISSALVTSYEAAAPGNSGGPYEETFPPYGGPFPSASAVEGCPVTSGRITQGVYEGRSHGDVCAYDFGSSFGSPVYATHDGCVAAMRSDVPNNTFVDKSFGNYIRLVGTNPGGSLYYTTYAHFMSGSALRVGQCVSAGDIIGYVDTTGFTFDAEGNLGGGTHLHYQYDGGGCVALPAGCGTP